MKKKDLKYTLIDTEDAPSYNDYLDFCKANDFKPAEEDSEEFYSYVRDTQSIWYNDELDNIKFSKENNTPVLVTGSLGLWDGRHDIYPVLCEDLHEAVVKCAGSSNDVKVEFDNGVIHVAGYHHDGTNRFTIHKLSALGMKRCNMLKSLSGTEFEVNKKWTKRFNVI